MARITRGQASALKDAIKVWKTDGTLSPDDAHKLVQSIEVVPFDWKRLAKYSFWISLICIVIAVGAVLADEALMQLLAKLFRAPAIAKSLAFAILAAGLFHLGLSRRKRKPEKIFSNEALFFLGVLSTAGSIAFFGKAIGMADEHFSLLLLFASLVYGVLGLWFPSGLVWIFALLSLGGWLGAETGYVSGWGAYYLGMNYPLRFVLFGLVLTATSFVFQLVDGRRSFADSTRAVGFLYLFIALWIMSIFGNYGDMHEWQQIKQYELFHWSLLFGLAAGLAIFHGIRCDDKMSRGFGLTFLFINLYTRFFEYFWEPLHKAIFFALLALSFWYLGTHAERIWLIGQQRLVNLPNR